MNTPDDTSRVIRMRLRDQIWFRQTAYTIALGLILGLTLSVVTIFLDLVEERQAARDRAIQVVEVMRQPAGQAVFNIDPQLAEDVAEGLFHYRLFREVIIVDDVNVTLAKIARPQSGGLGYWLAAKIFGTNIKLNVVIPHPEQDADLGSIIVVVDSYLMAEQFFQRSFRTLIGALIRNIILCICLLALFYKTLTKPLTRLALQIASIDPKSPNTPLKLDSRFDATEFQDMTENLNQLLSEFSALHTKQQKAEGDLRSRKDELAGLVEERTAELNKRNEDLKHEISERHEIETALRNSKRAAEEASRAKSQFLSNMSHELRAPMTAILGFSQIMGKETYGPLGSPQYIEYAKDIHKSGDHLLSLINELLDLAKIEAGEYKLSEERIQVKEAIDFVFDILRSSASEKSISLTHQIARDASDLFADDRALKQIIINLVSNSIKFMEEGGQIEVQAFNNTDHTLSIVVGDNGIGMSERGIARVFEPFAQVSDPNSNIPQGTGLGLSITKELVELHQGTISITSEKGVGTQIAIKFPPERTLGLS